LLINIIFGTIAKTKNILKDVKENYEKIIVLISYALLFGNRVWENSRKRQFIHWYMALWQSKFLQ
jgi:hypothetical protein